MTEYQSTKPKPWSLVKDQTVFDCPYFVIRSDQVKDGRGRPRHYYNVRMKNFGIAVVPIDSAGYTILVGQQRYVLDRFTWEVIRGGGDVDIWMLPLVHIPAAWWHVWRSAFPWQFSSIAI